MSSRQRSRPRSEPKAPLPLRPSRPRRKAKPLAAESIVRGRAIDVDLDRRTASVSIPQRGFVKARLPQHVSADWLHAAARLRAVDVTVLIPPSGEVLLCGVFPSAEHAAVAVDVAVVGRRVTVEAHEQLEIRCSRGSLFIDAEGNVTVRGKELLSRAAGANRISGGVIRHN